MEQKETKMKQTPNVSESGETEVPRDKPELSGEDKSGEPELSITETVTLESEPETEEMLIEITGGGNEKLKRGRIRSDATDDSETVHSVVATQKGKKLKVEIPPKTGASKPIQSTGEKSKGPTPTRKEITSEPKTTGGSTGPTVANPIPKRSASSQSLLADPRTASPKPGPKTTPAGTGPPRGRVTGPGHTPATSSQTVTTDTLVVPKGLKAEQGGAPLSPFIESTITSLEDLNRELNRLIKPSKKAMGDENRNRVTAFRDGVNHLLFNALLRLKRIESEPTKGRAPPPTNEKLETGKQPPKMPDLRETLVNSVSEIKETIRSETEKNRVESDSKIKAMTEELSKRIERLEKLSEEQKKTADKQSKQLGEAKQAVANVKRAVDKSTNQWSTAAKTGKTTRSTFAEVVKGRIDTLSKSDPPCRVIIRKETEDPDKVREAVRERLKPQETGIPVEGLRRVKNGVLIESSQKLSIDKVKEKFADYEVRRVEASLPRVRLVGVPALETDGTIQADLLSLNLAHLPEAEKALCKVAYSYKGRFAGQKTVIARVTPSARRQLIDKGYVHISWKKCKIEDYIEAPFCLKCGGYGHRKDTCREADPLCFKCGKKGHSARDCKAKEPTCRNCVTAKRKDTKHGIHKWDCPFYRREIEFQIRRTDWGEAGPSPSQPSPSQETGKGNEKIVPMDTGSGSQAENQPV